MTARRMAGLLGRIDSSGGPDACWPWLGHHQGSGYGLVDFPGTSRGAHRVVYVLAVAPLDDSRPQVLHSCDNPPCVNPAHLSPGTARQNKADAMARGRARGPVLSPDGADYIPRLAERLICASRRRRTSSSRARAFKLVAQIFDVSPSHAGTLYDQASPEERLFVGNRGSLRPCSSPKLLLGRAIPAYEGTCF